MLNTLLAVGIASIGFMQGLTPKNNDLLEHSDYYIGEQVQNYLAQNIFNFEPANIYSAWQSNKTYTFSLEDNTTSQNQIGMLLAPLNNALNNQPILVYPNQITTNSNLSSYTIRTENNSYVYQLGDYEPIGFIYDGSNKKIGDYLVNMWWASPSTQNTQYTINYNYKVRQYTIAGMFAPFKDNGTEDTTIYSTNQRQNPIETVLNTPFINNGFYYDEFNVYGANKLVSGRTYDVQYMNALYINGYSDYNVIANEPVYDRSDSSNVKLTSNTTWSFYGANTLLLLESDYVSTLNNKNQSQAQSLQNHVKNGATTYISGNGNVGNVFDLLANAFNGFGNFFGVMLLPGITIGALLVIPLVVGLIMWLINMFKRH